MGKRDKEPSGDGQGDYDHTKTKRVEDSSSGKHGKDDKGDKGGKDDK